MLLLLLLVMLLHLQVSLQEQVRHLRALLIFSNVLWIQRNLCVRQRLSSDWYCWTVRCPTVGDVPQPVHILGCVHGKQLPSWLQQRGHS